MGFEFRSTQQLGLWQQGLWHPAMQQQGFWSSLKGAAHTFSCPYVVSCHCWQVDFVFSCPPYFDLEKYSTDPKDLSNAQGYTAFSRVYSAIIKEAIGRLTNNRLERRGIGKGGDRTGSDRLGSGSGSG